MKTLNRSVGSNKEFCPGVCNAVMYNRFLKRRRSWLGEQQSGSRQGVWSRSWTDRNK